MKRRLFILIPLLIVVVVAVGLLYAGVNKRSSYNGEKVAKIEVMQLVHESEPVSMLTLTDKKSIGVVLAAINNARENVGRKKISTYKKFGTSTYLIEIYDENNEQYDIYIALGPNNKGTACYKDAEQYTCTIEDNDTESLRQLILNK